MTEDKHGFTVKEPPKGAEAVFIAVKNAEHLCGLDRNIMGALIKGEYSDYARGGLGISLQTDFDPENVFC